MEISKELILRRGKELFIFRYKLGQEDSLPSIFAEMAEDPKLNFDMFDAAVLCIKIKEDLLAEADKLIESMF
jgi:hypothetical protein